MQLSCRDVLARIQINSTENIHENRFIQHLFFLVARADDAKERLAVDGEAVSILHQTFRFKKQSNVLIGTWLSQGFQTSLELGRIDEA